MYGTYRVSKKLLKNPSLLLLTCLMECVKLAVQVLFSSNCGEVASRLSGQLIVVKMKSGEVHFDYELYEHFTSYGIRNILDNLIGRSIR